MAKKQKPEASEQVSWRNGFRVVGDIPAEKAFAELKEVMSLHGYDDVKQCTANDALSWCEQNPDSALHSLVGDWDDKSAARKWRVNQMRLVIRSIEIVYPDAPETPTRAFELDPSRWQKDDGYKPYRSTRDIMGDPEARALLLQRALGDLISVRRRYSRLQELSIVFRAIDEVLETIKA